MDLKARLAELEKEYDSMEFEDILAGLEFPIDPDIVKESKVGEDTEEETPTKEDSTKESEEAEEDSFKLKSVSDIIAAPNSFEEYLLGQFRRAEELALETVNSMKERKYTEEYAGWLEIASAQARTVNPEIAEVLFERAIEAVRKKTQPSWNPFHLHTEYRRVGIAEAKVGLIEDARNTFGLLDGWHDDWENARTSLVQAELGVYDSSFYDDSIQTTRKINSITSRSKALHEIVAILLESEERERAEKTAERIPHWKTKKKAMELIEKYPAETFPRKFLVKQIAPDDELKEGARQASNWQAYVEMESMAKEMLNKLFQNAKNYEGETKVYGYTLIMDACYVILGTLHEKKAINEAFEDAKVYYNNKDFEKAIPILERIVKARGGADELSLLGRAWYYTSYTSEPDQKHGTFRKAIGNLEAAAEKRDNAEDEYILAEVLFESRKWLPEIPLLPGYDKDLLLHKAVSHARNSIHKGDSAKARWLCGEVLTEIAEYSSSKSEKRERFRESAIEFKKAVEMRGIPIDYQGAGVALAKQAHQGETEEKKKIALFEEAMPYLKKAVEKRGIRVDFHLLGHVSLFLGNLKTDDEQIELYKQAKTNLEKSLAIEEMKRTRVYLKEAKSKLEKAVEEKRKMEEEVKPRVREAQVLFYGEDYDKAIALYREALAKGSTADMQFEFGRMLSLAASKKEGDDALELLHDAAITFHEVFNQRGEPEDYVAGGTAFEALGDKTEGKERVSNYKEAIFAFKEALSRKVDDYHFHRLCDVLAKLMNENQKKEALKEFRENVQKYGDQLDAGLIAEKKSELAKLVEDDVNALIKTGIEHFNKEEFEHAIAPLEEAVELRGNANEHFLLGRTYSQLGDTKPFSEKQGIYEKSVHNLKLAESMSEDRIVLHWLGATLSIWGYTVPGSRRIQRYEEAIHYLEKAVSKENNPIDSHWLGKTWILLGKEREGKERRDAYRIAIPVLEYSLEKCGDSSDYTYFETAVIGLGNEMPLKERISLYKEKVLKVEQIAAARDKPEDKRLLNAILSELVKAERVSKEESDYISLQQAMQCLGENESFVRGGSELAKFTNYGTYEEPRFLSSEIQLAWLINKGKKDPEKIINAMAEYDRQFGVAAEYSTQLRKEFGLDK